MISAKLSPMSPDILSPTSPEFRKRLKMLYIAMYRENDGERNAAAAAHYRFLVAQKVHPNSIDLLAGINLIERNEQVIASLESELKRLAAENAYFRRRASAEMLREIVKAGAIDIAPWFTLYDSLISQWGEPLPQNWQHKLSKLTNMPPSIIKRWELGLVQVPDEVLEKVCSGIEIKKTAKRQTTKTAIQVAPFTPDHSPPKKRPTKLNFNQLTILQGINMQPGCTIRSLSFHLYGEPDSTEILAEVVSNMLGRKWVFRKPRDRETAQIPKKDRSKWQYWISDGGAQLLDENNMEA